MGSSFSKKVSVSSLSFLTCVMGRKERHFELSVSKVADSYLLKYSKGISMHVLASTNCVINTRLRLFIGPGKKALGEIRLDQVSWHIMRACVSLAVD